MPTTINRTAVATLAAAALTAFLLAGASRAEASTIFACVKKHAGTARIVSRTAKCKKGETKLSWNSQGPRGANGSGGAAGLPGTPGSQGHEGPQGPGATSFTTTLPEETTAAPLITLGNGVVVTGTCVGGGIDLAIETPSGNHLEASGTHNAEGMVRPTDALDVHSTFVDEGTSVDFDIIAADSTIGTFDRIDVHGSAGPPCTFWGMITPAS
jgi:hypothetical protein